MENISLLRKKKENRKLNITKLTDKHLKFMVRPEMSLTTELTFLL